MPPMIGQISLVPYNFAPRGWMFCDGTPLPIAENESLFMLIGTTFGGDGENTFALPNLTSAAPPNLRYCMSLFGNYPINSNYEGILGETILAPKAFAPKNMMQCAGQSILQSQAQILYIYMGARFGGDAQHFSLPDLRSKEPKNLQFLIALSGDLPDSVRQRTPYLGEIFLLPYQKPSQSLLICDGTQLPTAQNTALYNLIGTTFGGGGTVFSLPNLTSVAPTGYSYYIAVRDAVFPPRG